MKKKRFGCLRTLVAFLLFVMMIGAFVEDPLVALLFLVALLYILFMDRINDEALTRMGKMEKLTDIEYDAYWAATEGYRETPTAYIAEQLGVSEEKAVRDLMRLMDRGYFPDAWFDEEGNFVVPSNTKMRKPAADSGAELVHCPGCGAEIPAGLQYCYYCGQSLEAYRELEAVRRDSLQRIDRAAKGLKRGVPAQRIRRISELTDQILRKYEEGPALARDSSKFREYYLPKTVEAIEYYGKLCRQRSLSHSEAELKEQLEDSLGTIEEAFENILRRITEEGISDLSTDVVVLEAVLQRDGLMDPDFDVMV